MINSAEKEPNDATAVITIIGYILLMLLLFN